MQQLHIIFILLQNPQTYTTQTHKIEPIERSRNQTVSIWLKFHANYLLFGLYLCRIELLVAVIVQLLLLLLRI